MADRREFLAALAGIGIGRPRPPREVLSVDAVPTVFYGHPNGERNLVRLIVRDSTAPAGRIRVFGSGRELLGTAGVLGAGGRLIGELLLPLTRATTVTTELEVPGRSTPLRTVHSLQPPPRWTLHWIVVVEPDRLLEQLDGFAPYAQAAALGLLARAQVMGNPFAGDVPSVLADHAAFVRLAAGARDLERRFGIPSSPVAVAPEAALSLDAATTALNGAGVAHAVLLDAHDGSGFRVLRGRDGARVVAAAPTSGVDADSLGFGSDQMTAEIESWLLGPARDVAIGQDPTTLVVSRRVDDRLARMIATVEDWNRRYAYPQIVVGQADGYFAAVAREVEAGRATRTQVHAGWPDAPGGREVRDAATLRHTQVRERWQSLLAPVAMSAGLPHADLADFAATLSTALPGVLVFNPAPVSGTDRFTDPEGRERIATDVPALGYVYLPDLQEPEAPYLFPGAPTVSGRNVVVRLDPSTGAIASMSDLATSTEWASAIGLNAVRGARLVRIDRWVLPGVGSRLTTYRSTPFGVMRTEITAYDDGSWIDIENVMDGTDRTDEIEFGIAQSLTNVTYETPVGFEEATVPTAWVAHLRWVELAAAGGTRLLMRAYDAPWCRIDPGASEDESLLRSASPMSRSRYRLQIAPPSAGPDERWYFGWRAEPLLVARVPGRGTRSLPSYGRVLQTDVGALVVGLRPGDYDGVVTYVQDITGVDRTVALRPGLLAFAEARRVDLIGRDVGETLAIDDGAARVRLPRYGIIAVHIRGISLAGG